MTRKFGEGDREVGTRVNGTLETSAQMVGVHPKVVGISSELIFRTIEALVETIVLR
jgi:hypothetical protein